MYSLTPWGPGVLKKTDLWYSQIAQSGVVLKVGWRLIMFQLSPPPSPLTYTDEWTRWGLEPTAERGSNKGMFPLIFLDVMWEIHISSTSQVRNPYYLLQLACITESQKQTCYSLWQRLAGADYFVLTKRARSLLAYHSLNLLYHIPSCVRFSVSHKCPCSHPPHVYDSNHPHPLTNSQ